MSEKALSLRDIGGAHKSAIINQKSNTINNPGNEELFQSLPNILSRGSGAKATAVNNFKNEQILGFY